MHPVEQLRSGIGLTQRELAQLVGTSQPAIAAYETGAKSPSWRTIQRFASALGQEAVVDFVPPLTREDRRSIALHRAIARRVLADPTGTVARARRNLRRMSAANPSAAPLLREWRRILSLPPGDIADALVDPRSRARDLRQVTPFAGVLSPQERARLYRDFRASEQRAA